ncbi:hypothetical protein GLOTRDRAFT_36507 [Gloeophyllum trabeum ATCC 11539]|uniref:Uncharacterized protein n=1 Tax=Gloeophyllum trabeum (strain ATCC 11539 / FP-39264 / Madison 617) TaxID=670483 RepID=S7RU56_GLOTA|nr:uncharacterized protein GLOTRDRAFT_36507 [Gloeophyllum trabeum ATCC 11539]EPQ58250.1 hypothetical protein GLOTRDRAFT_36507 [Gloeophyllum trabeum ATCC 11539]
MTSPGELAAARAVDTEVLVRRSMTKGYQLFSLLTPPVYAATVLYKRGRAHFSVNRFLRATWIGGAIGTASGGAVEYVRASNSSEESLRRRRIIAAYNTDSLRADDHSTIGAILFAVLTPALFWKRARAVHLVLGGAGLGSSVGVLAHYGRNLSGDPPPPIVVPEAPTSA